MNINKILSIGLGVALLAGASACTTNGTETASEMETTETTTETDVMADDTDATAMDTWDNDRFGTTFESNNMYSQWDANADGNLDENEFNMTFYRAWDSNNDGVLDEAEWSTATADYGITGQGWADWDTNKDNNLSDTEFRTGFMKSNYMRDWDMDRDGKISQREYSDGLFKVWDTNRDGTLDANEYNTRYNKYYGGM
ncbi:hypothetical protein ABID22_002963 [Pontibacter aydingkolensis]|uniref:EF-hand domain-containing protein n=1 Tax=Pontibacter aydingkolensis TaxID=1911536 RepID=A0ABS7CUJ2_9BACT|nr:hypothetical protein [Pontibacter aydingkolensis]MBW7467524.1 hypothetical protein [Pontibacter aydingkolensis]